MRRVGRLGTQQNTRCIGDFNIKNGYSDHDILRYCEYMYHDFCIPNVYSRCATKAPGIAVPYVAGPIVINQARGFIIVMSDGLYDAWSAFMDQNTSNANIAIARMVAEQIGRGKQNNMEVVAQTVIDSVVSSVQYTYANSQKSECRRLDDITLMIHNLGYDTSDYPLSGIVNFPLATAPVPSVPPPMNTYVSQPGAVHQGQPFDNVRQGSSHYNQPIQHMPQSYDPRYIASQAPARGSQAPMNFYTPTPTPHYQYPPMTQSDNPFVFPSSQQSVPHIPGMSQAPVPPHVQYSQPGGQEHPNTNYNMPPIQSHHSTTNHSRGTSPSNYVLTNQSSGYSHSSSYNSSYSSNMPADGNQELNYSGSVSNTSLVNPQQHRQDVGRLSTSPVPPHVDYPTPQAQLHPQQSQPLPQHVQQAPGSRSGSSTHFQSTSDEDGEATPIADPSGKEVFPQSGKKPVPPPRTKLQPSGESLSTLTNAFQSLSTSGGTEIPPPQSSSTPTKQSDSQSRVRDSFDASNLKDEELYEPGDDEAPSQGSGEKVKPKDNQSPPLEAELPKSSEGSQLDQYIFDSDGEMEKQFSGNSTDDEIDDDDDDDMGVVDPSMLSSVLTGEEPTQNIVRSYIKFDNFPDIEYDAL